MWAGESPGAAGTPACWRSAGTAIAPALAGLSRLGQNGSPGNRPERYPPKQGAAPRSPGGPSGLILAEPTPPPGPGRLTILVFRANTPEANVRSLAQKAIPCPFGCHSFGRLVDPGTSPHNHRPVLIRILPFQNGIRE